MSALKRNFKVSLLHFISESPSCAQIYKVLNIFICYVFGLMWIITCTEDAAMFCDHCCLKIKMLAILDCLVNDTEANVQTIVALNYLTNTDLVEFLESPWINTIPVSAYKEEPRGNYFFHALYKELICLFLVFFVLFFLLFIPLNEPDQLIIIWSHRSWSSLRGGSFSYCCY